MHKYFPDWYRPFSVEPTEELLGNRWKAVEELADQADVQQVLYLVRLGHSQPPTDQDFLDWVGGVIRNHDPGFPLRDSTAEMSLLSAVAMIHIFESNGSNHADAGALAVSTAAFLDWEPSIGELPDAASSYLRAESVAAREVEQPGMDSVSQSLSKSVTALKEAVDQGSVQWPLVMDAVNALASEIRKLHKNQGVLREVAASEAVAEEVNILWWLLSERSRRLERSFESLGEASPLVLAEELASLTRVLPVVPSPEAFLERGLRLAQTDPDAKQAIAAVVNEAPREWRQQTFESPSATIEAFLPITRSIGRSLETNDAKSWVEPASSVTGVDLSAGRRLSEVSLQYYFEIMLARAVSKNS